MYNREFEQKLSQLKLKMTSKSFEIIEEFCRAYQQAVDPLIEETFPQLLLFLSLLEEQVRSPYSFEPYHQKIRHPIDYYQFGLDMISPLIDKPFSSVRGESVLAFMEQKWLEKENIILFGNHQTEADPQILSILLSEYSPKMAEAIIYVAGERVTADPLAIPFSMGCDLLCIYSKRYIDFPPELKANKQQHNKKTMERMSRLLAEGGKIIYVAPAGGRDRKNKEGNIEVAPFDPDSIEMFYLMSKKAKTTTHFIPLALHTYDLLPPPDSIQQDLGELRLAKKTAVHLFFGAPFPMETFPGCEEPKKDIRRKNRAHVIWNLVNQMYHQLINRSGNV